MYIALLFIYLFIYLFNLWVCWVFASARGLSPVTASGGHSSSRCAGLSPSRPLWLRSTGSRRAGSVTVAHGPSCSAACGILPDQGSNPCPLHWQADSQPLRHQGSPVCFFILQVLISHPSYTHQCVHVNPNRPIQHTTIPTPPRFSPLVSIRLFSTSVSQLLPCKPVHLYHFSRFHIHALIYDICFSLSDYFTLYDSL